MRQFIPSEDFDQDIGLGGNEEIWETEIDRLVKYKLLLRSDLYLFSRVKTREFLKNRYSKMLQGQVGEKARDRWEKEILSLRMARYYNDDKNNFREGKSVHILESLVGGLKKKNIPVLILFTPTNLDCLGNEINLSLYQWNRSYLEIYLEKNMGIFKMFE